MLAQLNFGIDPAGIGTTGIVAKSFGDKKISYHAQLRADNPIDSFNWIKKWIIEIKEKSMINEIGFIAVELLHGGKESYRQVKATRELIGLLRLEYKHLFKGHVPSDKNKDEILKKQKRFGLKNSHWIDAEAIMYAHINEAKQNSKCED